MRASFLCAVGCAAFLAPVNTVLAEEQDARVIEEIIVTATYRETNLMDTPQSISAMTDSIIEDLGAQDMSQIFRFMPGLNMTGEDTGNTRYAVRGITSQVGNLTIATVGSSVAVYLDNAPLTSALGAGRQITGNLFDIDRVEVLKGPQGTLFGESAQGGTIRYLFKQPDPTGFDAAAVMSVSSMNESDDLSHRLDAMVNIPLAADRWALRLVGFTTETAGYVDNLEPPEEDFNPTTAEGGRIALRYTGDRFDVIGAAYLVKQETEGGSAVRRPYESDYVRTSVEPRAFDDLKVYSLTADIDFSFATLTSITSYTDRDTDRLIEQTRENTDLIDFFGAFVGNLLGFPALFGIPEVPLDTANLVGLIFNNVTTTERFAQEFRLVSPGDRRFRWTAGVYYKDTTDRMQGLAPFEMQPGREIFQIVYDTLVFTPANDHEDELTERAVFGEFSYDITDTLEITAGARYAELEQTFGPKELLVRDQDDEVVSPKVIVSWRPADNWLVYASYTSGFRPGNANREASIDALRFLEAADRADAAGDPAQAALLRIDAAALGSVGVFKGDELISYELGVKATLWNGRVQAAAAIYDMDWDDVIQGEERLLGSRLTRININAGSASSRGIELEFTGQLTDALQLRVAGDLNSTKLEQGPNEGNDLVYAPDYSASIALSYDTPITDTLALAVMIDQAWVGEQFTLANKNRLVIPSYNISNLRVTLRDGVADKWRATLFVRNLTDEEILRDISAETADANYYNTPRQIGLELGWKL